MLQETPDTEEIIERVAALDIGKAELVACIRVPSPDTNAREMRCFGLSRGLFAGSHVE
jgi:transposase